MTIILDEPNETYHANPAIGSGNIRDFLKSPRLFRDNMDGLWPNKRSKSLDLGTLVHLYFLEPAKWEQTVVLVPNGLDRRTKDGKAWAEANAGKLLVSQEDWATIDAMASRCHGSIYTLLHDGQNEVTVRSVMDGLPCQCRFDAWHQGNRAIYDLKTTKDMDSIGQSVWNYGYHIQQEWYQRLALCETRSAHSFTFIFAETEPPYRWRIVTLADDLARIGSAKVDLAIKGIKERIITNRWADEQLTQTITAPAWAKE